MHFERIHVVSFREEQLLAIYSSKKEKKKNSSYRKNHQI